jgi:hypothetical protein
MSYILYSSIARAGGIDLLLGSEAVSHAPLDPALRRRRGRTRAARRQQLRRRIGRNLIRLGQALTRWGRRWAPAPEAAPPRLSAVS